MDLLQKKFCDPRLRISCSGSYIPNMAYTCGGALCETYTQHANSIFVATLWVLKSQEIVCYLQAINSSIAGKMNVPLATAAVQVLVTYCTATACVGRAIVTQPGHQIDSVCIPFAYVLPHCWNQLVHLMWDFCKLWKYSVSKQLWKMDLCASLSPMFLPYVASIW